MRVINTSCKGAVGVCEAVPLVLVIEYCPPVAIEIAGVGRRRLHRGGVELREMNILCERCCEREQDDIQQYEKILTHANHKDNEIMD